MAPTTQGELRDADKGAQHWYDADNQKDPFLQLKTMGAVWGTIVGGSVLYQWGRKDIPTNLKVIHTRMFAQGGVVAGIFGLGVYQLMQYYTAPQVANN